MNQTFPFARRPPQSEAPTNWIFGKAIGEHNTESYYRSARDPYTNNNNKKMLWNNFAAISSIGSFAVVRLFFGHRFKIPWSQTENSVFGPSGWLKDREVAIEDEKKIPTTRRSNDKSVEVKKKILLTPLIWFTWIWRLNCWIHRMDNKMNSIKHVLPEEYLLESLTQVSVSVPTKP